MDSLTQALYGAAVQGSLLGRQQGRRSLLYGALLGTLPDLDVIIRYADPISRMTYHRGFSHSLIVITFFSVLLAWLVRRWRPSPEYSGARLAFTIWAVLITHVLLDAFTAYGTQLMWPFAPTPAAWSNLFIVDPIFTIPLLAGVAAAGLTRTQPMSRRGPILALLFTTVYLAFTFASQWLVESRVREQFRDQGLWVERLHISSAPFTSLMWRVIVEDDKGRYHEGFASLLDSTPLEPEPLSSSEGGSLANSSAEGRLVHTEQQTGASNATETARSLPPPGFHTFERGLPLREQFQHDAGTHALHERLRWFTGDWLRYDEVHNQLVVTDLRMGLAGRHFFRFVVAERDTNNKWQAVEPRDWPGLRGDREELLLVLRRIWNSDLQVPLAAWEGQMRAGN